MDRVIELKNITYTYPLAEAPSLKNVNLTLEKGRFYALLGAGGSGKTTLCNVIRGFIPGFFQGDLQGEVLLEGRNLQTYSDGELALKMGYVFQNPFNQITGARDTVYEEIAFGLENFGVEPAEIRRRVDRVSALTNTVSLHAKNPFELSGGQQQRVALAAVLVLEPDILIIDEPTSQLDPQETERIFEIIDTLKEMGKTVILVEHKIEIIAKYADEVIVLQDGNVVRFGEKHQVLTDLALSECGVELPEAVHLTKRLRTEGYPIGPTTLTLEELAGQLKKLLQAKENRYGNDSL